jgi:hypothetical protein
VVENSVTSPAASSDQANTTGPQSGTETSQGNLAGSNKKTLFSFIGRITQTSKVPAPGTAPYKDCLTFIKLEVESVEEGAYDRREVMAVFLAMRNDEWLPPAKYAVGDRLRLTVIPLNEADFQIRSLQRADNLDDFTLRPFFVLEDSRIP